MGTQKMSLFEKMVLKSSSSNLAGAVIFSSYATWLWGLLSVF